MKTLQPSPLRYERCDHAASSQARSAPGHALPDHSTQAEPEADHEALMKRLTRAVRLDRKVRAFVAGRLATGLAPRGGGGPLQGLPVGIKDNIRTADFDSTFGADIPADPRDRFDADIVSALRERGAVICGKTAMAEFALFRSQATRNPKAWSRTPGGSSSGSAAVVAAGILPLAIGTQTAGSVIRPAAFCGVVGFKPTFGLLSCRGVEPLAPSLDTLGFFAGSVADVLPVASSLLSVSPQEEPRHATLRLGYCGSWADTPVTRPVTRAMEQTLAKLETRGLRIERIGLPAELAQAHDAHGVVMGYEAVRSLRPWSVRRPAVLSTQLTAYLEASLAIGDQAYLDALGQFDEARAAFDEAMGRYDALLTPSAPSLPPIGFASTGSSAMNRLWTALHAPVLTLPLPRPAGRIPVGLQVIGARGADMRTIGIARVLERALATDTGGGA